MRTVHPLAGVIAATLIGAAGPAAAEIDAYFVHGLPYAAGYQPYSITKGALFGAVLVQPADACGLRFEGDFNLSWASADFFFVENIPAGDGISDVWLPSSECGAWQGVTVETDDGLFTLPYDMASQVQVAARAYWINSSGQKLAYLHQPCHPMPSCIQGPVDEALVDGWSDSLHDPIETLRNVQSSLGGDGKISTSLMNSLVDSLSVAHGTMAQRIQYRRQTHIGSLEKSIRQLEDAALAQTAEARTRASACRAALIRGDRSTATRACDAALTAALSARAALDTGDAWIVMR